MHTEIILPTHANLKSREKIVQTFKKFTLPLLPFFSDAGTQQYLAPA